MVIADTTMMWWRDNSTLQDSVAALASATFPRNPGGLRIHSAHGSSRCQGCCAAAPPAPALGLCAERAACVGHWDRWQGVRAGLYRGCELSAVPMLDS